MNWLLILSIIIVYTLLIFLTSRVMYKYFLKNKSDCILLGLIWPFTFLYGVWILMVTALVKLIGYLLDLWDTWEMNRND